MKADTRCQVLLAGSRSVNLQPFQSRSLRIAEVDLETVTDEQLGSSCGILIADFPGQFRQLNAYYEQVFERAFGHGLMTTVWAADAVGLDRAGQRKSSMYADHQILEDPNQSPLLIYSSQEIEPLAERLARHNPGPRLGTTKIRTLDPQEQISSEYKLLLQRAFSDCSSIVVERLPGGKTAKEIYRVYASLSGAEYGPHPMPFVVKIGRPKDIEGEKENYRDRAEPFIPFQLRPGLNESRCVRTLTSAALVCNFVDNAVPLVTALQNRQGAGAIFSLFEVTLRGLRCHTMQQAREANVVAQFIKERVRTAEIRRNSKPRINRARDLGLVNEPEEVEQKLTVLAAGLRSRRGVYHGDLHLGNVMVRHRDAILIDFGSMRDFGPSTADSAFLEVSLVFGTHLAGINDLFPDWKKFVTDLYRTPLKPPIPNADHLPFAWVHRAVRELRHVAYGSESSKLESLLVLCGALLRFARLSPTEFKNSKLRRISEDRHAYALVIAERICTLAETEDEKS